MTRVAIAVLGDLARSPRMLNHARELGAAAVLIGYHERPFVLPPGVRVRAIRTWRRAGDQRGRLSFLALSAARMAVASFCLFAALCRERPDAVLLQNPPSLPALTCAWLAARLTGARFVVDWHNYGFSLLALRLGARHLLVRFAAWYEGAAGRRADAHFCVSAAFAADLEARYGIRARVLRDLPVERLARTPSPRPMAVCPAGWTADEDMDMLLDAIELLPPGALEFHLTGDGPRRAALEPRIARLRERGAVVHTGFLPESEYWDLLRRASVGLSLHRSSSGLDLAMKVVDLQAVGVPVAALDYGDTLREQVPAAMCFRDARELAALLADPSRWSDAPAPPRSWREEWRAVAGPVLA